MRQRPGTAGGVCFMTIEDETGFANLVIFQSLFEKFRKEILKSRLIMVTGKLQIEGEVIHVVVKTCHDFSKMLRELTPKENGLPQVQTLAFPDETAIPAGQNKRPQVREQVVQENIFPEGKNALFSQQFQPPKLPGNGSFLFPPNSPLHGVSARLKKKRNSKN